MERIASRQNPLVHRFRDLARGPDSSGAALLDGAHLLQEALRSHVPVDLVAIADRVAARDGHALAEEAQRAGARVVFVSDHVLAAMSPVRQPSGVVAIARCGPSTLTEVLQTTRFDPEATAPGPAPVPLVLILAGVQDAGNVGAIVRVAEGCGATGIICSEGTADPFGWKALRGAMGSTLRVPIAVQQPLHTIVAELQSRQVTLIATVPRNGTPLAACDLRGPAAIMFGAEGAGLPWGASAVADNRLTIPMRAPVESLNVAIAAALILFEASRQRDHH
jgi:RNA methyltransferase, TrmH family